MMWRWVWFRSRLTAIVASALIWIVLLSLVPDVVAAFVLLGLVLVVGWRTRPLLWWRFGIRRVGPAVAEVVWRAMVPLAWLRGRSQPQLWSSNRLHTEVVAADAQQLVLSERLIEQVSQHSVPDQDLRRLVVRALSTADVHRSRLVAAVEVFCLPWSILATAARAIARPVASLRLPTLAWHGRWLFVALAAADVYRQAHWPGLVMLLLAAIATVTTPRWNRSWASRQIAMADGFEANHPTPRRRNRCRTCRSSARNSWPRSSSGTATEPGHLNSPTCAGTTSRSPAGSCDGRPQLHPGAARSRRHGSPAAGRGAARTPRRTRRVAGQQGRMGGLPEVRPRVHQLLVLEPPGDHVPASGRDRLGRLPSLAGQGLPGPQGR